MKSRKIILLGGKGQSTNIVFNSLNKNFDVQLAIIEDKEPARLFLKRRIKRLGLITVIGQVLFQLYATRFLKRISRKRMEEIIRDGNLDTTRIPNDKTAFVRSVNSPKTIELIRKIDPDLIVVNGTRIISKNILQSTKAKFINTHAGITPMYRGVYGVYWALVNNDKENSGVTVHFVDEGIDTGNIIEQGVVIPTSEDNFVTYPLLQLSYGIEILNKTVRNYFHQTLITQKTNGSSKLYYHPTLWQYLYHRWKKGIK